MIILVTGAAGFIGFHTCLKLLKQGHKVIGLDNLNSYYDIALKQKRLSVLGIDKVNLTEVNTALPSNHYPEFLFFRTDICESVELNKILDSKKVETVIHLAAQAGVRYSIDHPKSYITSNINGFFNILEGCRSYGITNLIYASSSSVYGNTDEMPLKTSTKADQPISLYAATKRSNELMAHTYSHLFGIKTIGLRFFTVYGPLGRPDMAYFKFTKAILNREPIQVYNHGKQARDFTYIDDVTEGINKIVECLNTNKANVAQHSVYNLGKGRPEELGHFITLLEEALQMEATLEYVDAQPGDVSKTWADTVPFNTDFGFKPKTGLKEGLKKFTSWYLNQVIN